MTWTLIESARERDALLELYAKDGKFMIRANGLELMNGFEHGSETAMGALAARLAPSPDAHFLVGGLGLGYTTAALLEALDGNGLITVVELSAAVIDWFDQHVRASVLPGRRDNLRIVNADIVDVLGSGERFDVIILDVDNGPEPLVTAANSKLYAADGLRALRGCLTERGIAMLWSGFQSAGFVERAKAAGFVVTCEPFCRERDELAHYVYVLGKDDDLRRTKDTNN